MRLKKLVKGVAIALPILALAACGSTSTTDTESAETNQQTSTVTDNTVETGSVTPVMTPEEKRRLELTELRKEHIIYFDFDTSKISSEYGQLLEAHAEYLREHPSVALLVEGHADERGTPEYNIALGERRAKAVTKYLESLGVGQAQIETVSYGEEKPLDNSRTDSGFAKNRRAVLVY